MSQGFKYIFAGVLLAAAQASCWRGSDGYTVCEGRPFLLPSGEHLLAEASEGACASWCESLSQVQIGIEQSSTGNVEAAQNRWVGAGRAEHASVAAFSRLSLQLMAVSAPADLVADSHRAAIDEIKHAQLCFGLAKVFSGTETAPGAFVIPGGNVEISPNLGDMVYTTALEGGIGETVSALAATFELATLPASETAEQVKQVLDIISTDEAKHAALAWRSLLWAVTSARAEEAKTRLAAVVDLLEKEDTSVKISLEPPLFAGGPLSGDTKQSLRLLALRQFIVPSLNRLLMQDPELVLVQSGEESDVYMKRTFDQITSNLSHPRSKL